MTIFELAGSLDGGFHDALLSSYTVDLVARTARLRLEICVGDPAAAAYASREARRAGTLILSGVGYFAVDMPDPKYPAEAPFLVDLCSTAVGSDPNTNADQFTGRFFSSSTNSFIHFSAVDAGFVYDVDA